MTLSRGFTLLELIVVIAIIGLLSAMILASLGSARNKGADAAVKSNLDHARSQAEINYSKNECYSTTATCATFAKAACPTTAVADTIFADTTILAQIAAAKSAAAGGFTSCEIGTGGKSYAIAVQLKTDLALAWCTDSSGTSKVEGTAGGAALTQMSLNALITNAKCN